jgi:hypothetical protein
VRKRDESQGWQSKTRGNQILRLCAPWRQARRVTCSGWKQKGTRRKKQEDGRKRQAKAEIEKMKIFLDASPGKLNSYTKKYCFEFWQLQTPLSRRALAGVPYALDNGCFANFRKGTWLRQLEKAKSIRPVFVTLPDIVGDAVRTLDLFDAFYEITEGVPRALVLQDGIGNHRIPWHKIDAVFIGGSDNFKISTEAINACKVARMLDKWIHVGRVNTASRVRNFIGIADSIDGSGICKYDHMLEDVLLEIKGEHPQHQLEVV